MKSRSWMTRSSLAWIEGHVADLVHEERAAVRLLQKPFLAGDGAGERAADVAEKLALQKRLGERCAVDGEEAALAPQAVVVDRSRYQLLPGPGLAKDQDVRLAGGHLDGEVVDLLEDGASEDDRFLQDRLAEFAFEGPVLLQQLLLLQRVLQNAQDLLLGKGLGDVVVGPELDRLHG